MDSKYKSILITGGAGFIGSNFINFMLNKYSDIYIVNLDLLTYAGNLESLREVEKNERYKFVQGNILNRELIEFLLNQYSTDVIVNFAAESHVDRSIIEPDIFVKTNAEGTQVLLEAALNCKVGKYVQISTDEVYGSLGENGYFTEETPLMPNSPYSASKASGDHLVRAYHETYGLNTNITRCSNNYGPFQFPEKLIPLMVIKTLDNQPLPVYGNGQNVRDWLHVYDHCSAIDLVINYGRSGEVYNIGGHNEKTNIEIVELILDILKRPKELINFVEDRLGHDKRYAIDATKITTQLGWEPKYTFDRGIVETIEWYIKNQEWWRPLISKRGKSKNVR